MISVVVTVPTIYIVLAFMVVIGLVWWKFIMLPLESFIIKHIHTRVLKRIHDNAPFGILNDGGPPGTGVERCHQNCQLEVVRPGKVQCICDDMTQDERNEMLKSAKPIDYGSDESPYAT